MPRAGDLPMIEVVSHGVPTTMNPLGAKGAGEAGAVGSLAAITNAVCDALSDLGVRHIDPPLTSEKVWRILQKAKEETSRMSCGGGRYVSEDSARYWRTGGLSRLEFNRGRPDHRRIAEACRHEVCREIGRDTGGARVVPY